MKRRRQDYHRWNPDRLFAWLVVFYDFNGGEAMTRAQVEEAEHGDIATEVLYLYFAGLLGQKGWGVEAINEKLDHPYLLTLADYNGKPSLVLDFTDGSGRLRGVKR